jgi:hypothetical protein
MEPVMSWLVVWILAQHMEREGPLFPILCGVGLFVYLFPWLIAWARHHPQQVPIFLGTLFLGWTGLGWVLALVWSAWHFTTPLNAQEELCSSISRSSTAPLPRTPSAGRVAVYALRGAPSPRAATGTTTRSPAPSRQ